MGQIKEFQKKKNEGSLMEVSRKRRRKEKERKDDKKLKEKYKENKIREIPWRKKEGEVDTHKCTKVLQPTWREEGSLGDNVNHWRGEHGYSHTLILLQQLLPHHLQRQLQVHLHQPYPPLFLHLKSLGSLIQESPTT